MTDNNSEGTGIESKVVEGGSAEFENSSAKADFTFSGQNPLTEPDHFIDILAAQIDLGKFAEHEMNEDVRRMAYQFVMLQHKKDGTDRPTKEVIFKVEVDRSKIISYLEKDYGLNIRLSGLLELSSLDIGMLRLDYMTRIFPEFRALNDLDDKRVNKFVDNPYQSILTLVNRPVYIGATEFALANRMIKPGDNSEVKELIYPLNTKIIMSYAKLIGDLNNAGRYVTDYIQKRDKWKNES